MTRRELVVPTLTDALLELLAAPDIAELVKAVGDAETRHLYAKLLARLVAVRDGKAAP